MSLTPEDIVRREFKKLNIDKYHTQGFTGKRIVVLNGETLSSHGKMTNGVLKKVAPDCLVLNSGISSAVIGGKLVYCNVTINSVTQSLEQAIDNYNIKIITVSKSGNSNDVVLEHFRYLQKRKGVIFVNAAGNEGSEGVDGLYTKDDTSISIGSVYIYDTGEVRRMVHSAIGEELDFVAPLGGGQGTSASAPYVAGMIALLLNKYGDFNQVECVEILKSISLDLGDDGKDNSYGYGLPILPLGDRLEILDDLRKEKEVPEEPVVEVDEDMEFKDVESDRWSKPAIDCLVERGELKGFEDGTFRPSEPLTREQYAQARYNQLKLEGRI